MANGGTAQDKGIPHACAQRRATRYPHGRHSSEPLVTSSLPAKHRTSPTPRMRTHYWPRWVCTTRRAGRFASMAHHRTTTRPAQKSSYDSPATHRNLFRSFVWCRRATERDLIKEPKGSQLQSRCRGHMRQPCVVINAQRRATCEEFHERHPCAPHVDGLCLSVGVRGLWVLFSGTFLKHGGDGSET